MEKIKAEHSIQKNEDILLKILEDAPIGILAFSADWKIEFVNENLVKIGALYNIDLSDIAGNNILKTGLFPDISFSSEFLELKEGFPFERELRNIKTVDRGSISLFLKASPVFYDGVFSGGILILEDIKTSSHTIDEVKFKSEAFENLFSRLDDLLFIADNTGEVKFSYGKKIKQINPYLQSSNFPISEIINPLQIDEFNERLQTVISKRQSKEILLEFSSGGKSIHYECRIEPFVNRNGQVQFVFLLMKDITGTIVEKKNLEAQINDLTQFREIASGIGDALFAVDFEGKIIFWNSSSENLFGYTKSEVFEKFFGKALGLFDEAYFEKIRDELSTKKIWKINLNIFKKDGSKEVVDAKFTLAGDNDNTIIILCSNITERIESEKLLMQSEEKFRSIVANASELICNLNPDGTINYANKAFLDSLKYSEEEAYAKNFTELIDSDYIKGNFFDLKTFERGRSKDIELPLLTKKGYPLFVVANFSPVYTENNVLKSYNGFFIDITQRKFSEKDLMIFQSLFKSSQDGIAVECDGKLLIANESFANIFGYEKAETLIKREFLDLISNADALRVAEYIKIVEQKKKMPGRLECLGKRFDSSNFFIEVSAAAFESEKKSYTVLITRDITERKRAQQVIRESEEKYRNITENIDDFLYTFDRVGKGFRPTFYTSSVEKITGYTQTEFLSDAKLILKVVHPDDFLILKKKLKTILRSRIQLAEEFEFRVISKQGNIVWIRNKINFSRSNDGRVQRIYGLVSDITFRKRAEYELGKSTESLVKLNETKDKFIQIISHDLRTPFTSILGFTDLLLSDDGLNEAEKKQYISFIRESSQSMLALVNSLLDWTRLQTGQIKFEPEKSNISPVIESSINALNGAAFQKNIKLSHSIDEELFVFIDKNLIMQAFNNLISNSIKFTNPGGKIDISASHSSSIRFIEFSIKDNGIGIKPENVKNLFRVDTKFTSEGTAGEKGSGLGLSLVKEIIEKHGGSISVESVYGSGTEFKFLLPVASANILLVDDSKTDRLLYKKILKNITPDYIIDIASNGKEALEKVIASPPALVITDHLMPEMSGYEFIHELKKADIKGKPPVIVLSSGLDRNTISDYSDIGIEYVFSKPVNLSSFKLAVEKSLKKGLR